MLVAAGEAGHFLLPACAQRCRSHFALLLRKQATTTSSSFFTVSVFLPFFAFCSDARSCSLLSAREGRKYSVHTARHNQNMLPSSVT